MTQILHIDLGGSLQAKAIEQSAKNECLNGYKNMLQYIMDNRIPYSIFLAIQKRRDKKIQEITEK